MDEENRRALEALQSGSGGPLMGRVRQRSMTICPHCHEGFGSASLPIHIRRCRALYPTPEHEQVEKEDAKPPKPVKKKEIYSLVDMCLRLIVKNFEPLCMEKVMKFPDDQAALIASVPMELVHRIIINLVHDMRKLAQKEHSHRAKKQKLEKELLAAKQENAQLHTNRHDITVLRNRLLEQQQQLERLQRQLDVANQELTAADVENHRLRSQYEGFEKTKQRLEMKINQLAVEKDKQKALAKEAQKRETDATKQLARASKSLRTIDNSGGSNQTKSKPAVSSATRISHTSLSKSDTSVAPQQGSAGQRIVLRKRPHSDISRIPFPSTISKEYLDRLEALTL